MSRSTLAILLILLAGIAAYSNSFTGPFVFDDLPAIPENPTIRHLWPPWQLFMPPNGGGFTVCGRPILNASFGLNYALSGNAVLGYHIANLLIHLLAALTLFSILRRTLENTSLRDSALEIATISALLWTLHPAQTESVTYLVQRAESLCGLFYLLTLYYFIRGRFSLSVLTCTLGMGTKEVAATAPLLVLLYDRTFVTGSFRKALAERRSYYTDIAATWILLALCIFFSENRGNTVGFQLDVTPATYALTEIRALVTYLGIILWPHPLVFDYGPGFFLHHATQALPYALLLLPLLAAIVYALVRRSALGFLGAWFFLILAPTSTFIPLKDALWDHRLYLSLAAPAVLAAIGLHRALGRRAWIGALLLIAIYGTLSWERNRDYRSDTALYAAAMKAAPDNPRPSTNLAGILINQHSPAEAMPYLRQALQIDPEWVDAHYNLGVASLYLGDLPTAERELNETLRLEPTRAEAEGNLGVVLEKEHRRAEAMTHFQNALRFRPNYPEVQSNLGTICLEQNDLPGAVAHFQTILHFDPRNAEAHFGLGTTYQRAGAIADAAHEFAESVRFNPASADAQINLGNTLIQTGHPAEAVPHLETALALDPKNAIAQGSLGIALAMLGRTDGAISHFREACRLDPRAVGPCLNLGITFQQHNNRAEAIAQFHEALRIDPHCMEAQKRLRDLNAP